MSTAQYITTRLGSRETGLTSILRRNTRTQTRWPNPERSIGRFICKVGTQSIWEAQGEARETFKTIAPDIKRYLDSCVEPIPSWVTWSMYMMGHNAECAYPTIVFCCAVSSHRREVRDTIKHSGILDRYPGVKTGHMPRAPDFDHLIPLAVPKGNGGSKITIQLQMSPTALGMPLFITGCAHGQQFSTKATIGGVICVGDKHFYTTTAHPFQGHQDPSGLFDQANPENQDSWDIDDDACSFDGDSDIDFEVKSELSCLNTVLADEAQVHNYEELFQSKTKEQEAFDPLAGNNRDRRAAPKSTEEPNPDYESCLSSTTSMTAVEFNYDGEFFLAPRDSPGTEADFALLEVTDQRHWVQNTVSTKLKPKVAIKSLSKMSSNDKSPVSIQALTSRGNTQGRLSGTPLYARAPNDKAFQKMLCANFSDTLEKGDCGSWVIDADTGDLYGHIVAGSPSSGTALIKLFDDVFEHIRYRTGYLPKFPTMDPTSFRARASRASIVDSIISRNKDKLISPSDRSKDRIEDNTSTTSSDFSNSNLSLDIRGYHNVSKNTICKGKTIQSKDMVVEEWMEPLTRRFQLNNREESKPKKLVYPTLLHTNNDTRLQMTSTDSRLYQGSTRPPPYASLPSQPPLSSVIESKKFCNLLSSLSRTPLAWENAGLLDEALRQIPLSQIYDDAEDEFNIMTAIAMSIESTGPDLGYQDCVVRALMRWFRRDYFKFVNNPACDFCLHPTLAKGMTSPTEEEKVCGALRVELYQCTHPACSRLTRFPRYTDPWVLMETRRGRVGEWVHVFSLFCCAIGSRTRWVWNAEDHVWVEVYSKHVDRWVHVDVIEGAWDKPGLYSEGWGKALSYCIAFSTEGAVDVTRRYVRQERFLRSRNRCSELTLFYMLKKITSERRSELRKQDQERLEMEDAMEQKELQTFHVLSIIRDLIVSLAPPLGPGPSQQRPRNQGPKNISLKLALEEKWLEDTRELMNDYCEWDSLSPRH
ncbi:hypothetical protein GQX73_g4120 [Xylaria multiplex]|uniref:Transglutaminase-like domain-containing protein n=1 Tax=Xylaria multiplex TaxID=323545 RepID=A0A7C8MVJ0_9PEZI|nr:hypothetical protein GQX73_g4120 [Xylaria multiplex]